MFGLIMIYSRVENQILGVYNKSERISFHANGCNFEFPKISNKNVATAAEGLKKQGK